MNRLLPYLLVATIFLTVGCSFVEVVQHHYKSGLPEKLPQNKQLSFASKESLAAGATLQNMVAAKLYYQGAKPLSHDAEVLYEMSYRFLGLVGVNRDFDPNDPESIEEVFRDADNALKEKDKNLHELKVQVDNMVMELATKTKIIKDKEAEMEAKDGTWSARLGTWKYIASGLFIFILLIPIILLAIQLFTGIPVFTGFMQLAVPFVKNVVAIGFNAAKQTAKSIDEWKDKWKKEIAARKRTGETEKAAIVEEVLSSLKDHLGKNQDESVKDFIQTRLKANQPTNKNNT